MNRTDRLLAIVLELQGRGRLRAEDLAATFETSKRTIYRDIEALCEAGVPLVSTPGRGYTLMEGYFLPPLSFSADEAIMLLLGSDFMSQNFDAQYRQAAESAGRKIAGVLDEKQRTDVQYLLTSLRFIATTSQTQPIEMVKLQQLRRAIIQRVRVHFRYQRRHGYENNETGTPRDVDPYGLLHMRGAWYLIGYCHLRQGMRFFRLERIDGLELLDSTFERPTDFTLRPDQAPDRGHLLVRILFDRQSARWVRESSSFFVLSQEDTADGLLVTLQVRDERDILQWVLGWGSHAHVLEPMSLRQLVAQEAQRTLALYSPPS